MGFEPKKDEIKKLISGIITEEKEKEENEEANTTIDLNEFMQIMQLKMVRLPYLTCQGRERAELRDREGLRAVC